jgi:hypothetical protein
MHLRDSTFSPQILVGDAVVVSSKSTGSLVKLKIMDWNRYTEHILSGDRIEPSLFRSFCILSSSVSHLPYFIEPTQSCKIDDYLIAMQFRQLDPSTS